ncbi:MAG: hypothetical protein Q8O05_05500, partial [Chloroflexota bacterium]|nr:hypothetical protein [Chloroflexota bacterium]
MNLESIIARILELTATLDPRTAFLLFIVCAVGEIGFGIPYILESVWLLIGYQFGAHVLSLSDLLVLWVAAQSGRQVGSIVLYHAARLGTTPLVRLYRRGGLRFLPKLPVNAKMLDRVKMSSPFSVAFGRLVGLRIPLSLTLAVRRDAKTLSL